MATNPTLRQLISSPTLLLAFGFGSGLAPRAPGTAGTLAALLIWPFILVFGDSEYLLFLLACTILGVAICGSAAKKMGVHDHGGIVWDEFVGLWIALIGCPLDITQALCAFALFRLFDIAKPWPIGWLDKRVPGGAGIMLDDIVAGVMALCCMLLLRSYVF